MTNVTDLLAGFKQLPKCEQRILRKAFEFARRLEAATPEKAREILEQQAISIMQVVAALKGGENAQRH